MNNGGELIIDGIILFVFNGGGLIIDGIILFVFNGGGLIIDGIILFVKPVELFILVTGIMLSFKLFLTLVLSNSLGKNCEALITSSFLPLIILLFILVNSFLLSTLMIFLGI